MNGSIYLIKNEVNNKMYIGQTIQPVEKRFKQHLKLLKTNEKQAISKAIKSIGKDKFSYEILADRKSTRLNSSHVSISYAVFCLKKKKKTSYMYTKNRTMT